jgi:hypothetical protein
MKEWIEYGYVTKEQLEAKWALLVGSSEGILDKERMTIYLCMLGMGGSMQLNNVT